jgi:hypothetical protein
MGYSSELFFHYLKKEYLHLFPILYCSKQPKHWQMQKNDKEQSNATRCRYQFNPGNKSSENCHSNWFSSSLEHSRSKLHAVRKVVEQRKKETRRATQEHLFFIFFQLLLFIIIYLFLYTNAKTRLLMLVPTMGGTTH